VAGAAAVVVVAVVVAAAAAVDVRSPSIRLPGRLLAA
jgi:hypothetical protein